ncbi:MAG: bifunctional demethylmenaquinone methyltransferase/2-methoxy-6-polyprenyl-1,4-benzoquinol methylase UbiE [Planctomycetales bacterium]|nr:bifunctional demethylmenaquinone methyltransferase/2-methoxy-6-polyprenyl-1,4-benzoquinol methylase UbiE [Planctomycetales bacterium]
MNLAAKTTQVDKSGDRVRDMFAQIAPRYDTMNHLLSLGIDIHWRKSAVRKLRIEGSLPILDCCTGTGDLALMLAKRVEGRGIDVVGTDFCAPMIDLAQKKHHAKYPNLSVRFFEADSQSLPFDDGAFQLVTVAFGLRNVQDTEKGLREMVRVCAAGGQLAVLEFSQPSAPGLSQLYQAYFRHILPRVGQALAKNSQSAYAYLPNSVIQFPSGKAFASLMEHVGLANIKIFPLTLGIATLYLGDASKSEASGEFLAASTSCTASESDASAEDH